MDKTTIDLSATYPAFSKIPRLFRECVISEKIDGTNGLVFVQHNSEPSHNEEMILGIYGGLRVYAGSRNRWLNPECDNYGFAGWVLENACALAEYLGPGRHYGEWYGRGIQRNYGLDHRRFALFRSPTEAQAGLVRPQNVEHVPILDQCLFTTEAVRDQLNRLKTNGSFVVPGFMNPEGVVVWHERARQNFKVLLENDEQAKGAW